MPSMIEEHLHTQEDLASCRRPEEHLHSQEGLASCRRPIIKENEVKKDVE